MAGSRTVSFCVATFSMYRIASANTGWKVTLQKAGADARDGEVALTALSKVICPAFGLAPSDRPTSEDDW